ncbi:MAG: ATP-dependent zinc protease family protein, partial [Microcystaceae cyanobacterium]
MTNDKHLPVIGWREWLTLPDLGMTTIRAKIDTGARSSALHAFELDPFSYKGKEMIAFKVHPKQRDTSTITAEAEILDKRKIRNSGGHTELRFVILTSVELSEYCWTIELTLTNRDLMGFRMLLGRQAIRRRFLVNPSKSYLLGGERIGTDKEDKGDGED